MRRCPRCGSWTTTSTARCGRRRTARALEGMLTESDRPVPPWMTTFDSPVGLAVRRWCAPVLDLEPLASAEAYLERRAGLGEAEVTRRLLRASGVGRYLVETGFQADAVLTPDEMALAADAPADEVVRLEPLFEELARGRGCRRGRAAVPRRAGRAQQGRRRAQERGRLPVRVRLRARTARRRRGAGGDRRHARRGRGGQAAGRGPDPAAVPALDGRGARAAPAAALRLRRPRP